MSQLFLIDTNWNTWSGNGDFSNLSDIGEKSHIFTGVSKEMSQERLRDCSHIQSLDMKSNVSHHIASRANNLSYETHFYTFDISH